MIATTTVLTEKELCAKFTVTPELLDATTRIINCTTGEVFYQSTSLSTGETYDVHFCNGHFTCTCKAGQIGFIHCKRYCKHVRAAFAIALEHFQAENAQARQEAEAARVSALRAEYAANMAALVARQAAAKIDRGFSLLK